MNEAEAFEPVWTRRRWVLTALLMLVLQLAFIFWFSNYQSSAPGGTARRTPIEVMNPRRPPKPAFAPERADPTVFALVTPESFSGAAWLTVPPFRYEPIDHPEPPRWLPLASEELGDDFAEFVQTNLLSEDLIADRLPVIVPSISVPNPIFSPAVVLRLEGGLAGRQIRNERRLPQVPEVLVTNKTVVRVLVEGGGRVISAALLSSCGLNKIDLEAMEYAKSAQFAGPDKGVAQGDLVFQWWRADLEKSGAGAAKGGANP